MISEGLLEEYCCAAVGSRNISKTTPSMASRCSDVVSPKSVFPMTVETVSGVTNVQRSRRLVQCLYCCELFDPSSTKSQLKCRDAPDRIMDRINIVSCVCLADVVAYHCFSDSEGDYEPTCVCRRPSRYCVLKWSIAVLMSVFLPCMCCFWPLIACRKCASECGYCVPQHRAA